MFDGGFHRVCQNTLQNPSGNFKEMSIVWWSPEEKVYRLRSKSSDGTTTDSRLTLSKNTWIETNVRRDGGKLFHWRLTSV